MFRRLGVEGQPGKLGDGSVSEESRKNLEKAEHYLRQRNPNKAAPFLAKAMEDPNNLDAIIAAAFLQTLPEALEFIEIGEENGRRILKRNLDNDCFDDNAPAAGKFWDIVQTRPYMRVLQAVVRIAFENKEYAKSVHACSEMLRLSWEDKMGQRDWLGSLLVRTGRYADALSFAQTWLSEEAERGPIPGGGTRYTTPKNTPMSPTRYAQLSKWAPGALVYTAAIGAFKLWGNCELACQYLRIGAKVMPMTLTKILARVEPPKSLNMNPREFNGPEATQDYLWVMQDLWMESDVWAWADADPEAKKSGLRSCNKCHKTEKRSNEYKRCSGCREVCYCGPECQKEDWKAHKKRCIERQQIEDMKRGHKGGRIPRNPKMPVVAMDYEEGKPFMWTGK